MSQGFDTYAVQTRTGPHLTVQAGVVHAGRYWTTTARSSLKTRSIRRCGMACAVTSTDAGTRVVAGRTTAFRLGALGPLARDPLAPLHAASAVARLGIGNVEQLIGYAQAGRDVPADWLPHRRALLVTRIDRSLLLVGDDVVAATGAWAGRDPQAPVRAVTGDGSDLPIDELPASHRSVVDGTDTRLGLLTEDGPVALPATRLEDAQFAVSTEALAAVGTAGRGPAVVLFDESASRRPDEKLGVMFRGTAMPLRGDGARTVLRVDTERITTWDGFSAATIPV